MERGNHPLPSPFMSPLTRCAILFLNLTAAAFLLGGVGFVIAASVLEMPFGGLFRMFMYHEEHAFEYIGLVAVIFGAVGTVWHRYLGGWTGWKRWLSIIAVMVVTILLASAPGGVLYAIHDMQAGYFPEGERFRDALWWGAEQGLMLGWLVILGSIPYNVLGLIIGALVLHRLPGMVLRR